MNNSETKSTQTPEQYVEHRVSRTVQTLPVITEQSASQTCQITFCEIDTQTSENNDTIIAKRRRGRGFQYLIRKVNGSNVWKSRKDVDPFLIDMFIE